MCLIKTLHTQSNAVRCDASAQSGPTHHVGPVSAGYSIDARATCSQPGIFVWALYSSHDPLVVVIQESDRRFGELLRSPREAQGLSFSHQINGPTVSQRLGRGDGKDQGTLPQLFTHYVMCSENMYKSRTCKNRRAARGGSTLPALAKPPVSSNTEVSSPPTVAVWPPTHRPVSGSGPQPLKGQEQGKR